jgi:glycosyltransferase involved in cell wall biosynthesis
MPSMGYQEFLLPKWNRKQNNETYILTTNKYYPVPNYDQTWKKFLGNRERKQGWFNIEGVKVLKKKINFEISSRPWMSSLEDEVLKIKPDVIMVHGTTSFSALRVALLCKYKNIPCLFDNHMVFSVVKKNPLAKIFYFFVKNILSKIISNVAYKVIGVTNETCKYLEQYEGYNKKKLFHLPLGIDDTIFYPLKHRENKVFKIIQTGKLNNDKKPQWTADAVLELLKNDKNVTLKFIGRGSKKIKSDIKKKFEINKLSKYLKFTDFLNQKELHKAYNQSDLCIFPDGTSLSALEIAACKKPVIMADYIVSRNREKLGIGLTYKTGDIDDLKKKILSLSSNKKFYIKVSNNGYKAVRKDFTYDQISKKFIQLCKQAVIEKKKNEKN